MSSCLKPLVRWTGPSRNTKASILPVSTDDDEGDILGVDSWVYTELEITLDSGCCEHVTDLGDIPGYGTFLAESDGSRRRQNFVVGNGLKFPNGSAHPQPRERYERHA